MTFDSRSVAFLHVLQRDLFGPSENREADDADAVQNVAYGVPERERENAASTAHTSDTPVPTPYEFPQNYSILASLADDIVTALEEDVALPDPPLVGSLPLDWPTALLLRVPDSPNHLAVVDRAFTVFANLLAKACAQGLMPDPDDDSIEAWRDGLASPTHPGTQRFVELISATLHEGPAAAPAYWPDPEWSPIATEIRTAVELFVVAEPFVHLALGNADISPVRRFPEIHPKAESYVWTESQRSESFSLRLMIMAIVFDRRRYDRALGFWGIDMFLRTLVLLQALQTERFGRAHPLGALAQAELGWLRSALANGDENESRSIEMLDQFEPVAKAFVAHAKLAVGREQGSVH